jgi:hypothetical protein
LVRIVAFVVLLGALGWGLDRMLTASMLHLSTGEFGVWNRIVQGSINADVVISGSSRALTHYDPRVLQPLLGRSVFNIGLNGSQTDMQLARLQTYLLHNRKPSLVIHNLDTFSLQVTHGEVYDPSQYVPYLDQAPLYEALARVDSDVWRWRQLPLYGYATQDMRLNWVRGLLDWIAPPREDTHVAGFTPRDWAWRDDFERFRARHPQGVHIDVEPRGEQQLEALARVCREEGIRLVLAFSPEYAQMQAITTNRLDIVRRFEALAQRNGALFLDFSDSALVADRRYFYNSQHLNAQGAALFSRELAQRLDAAVGPLLAGRSTQ